MVSIANICSRCTPEGGHVDRAVCRCHHGQPLSSPDDGTTSAVPADLRAYSRAALTGMGFGHKRVHHAAKVYVEGDVHVNSLEGFWSLVKRGIGGVLCV